MSLLKIDCPNCGASNQVDEAKVPEGGAWATCASCGHRMFIEPGGVPSSEEKPIGASWGAPASPENVSPQSEELPKEPLYLKTPTGQTALTETVDIKDGILWGKILPWDLISIDGSRFEPIQKHPHFGTFFREVSVTFRKNCWNHPRQVPEKICVRCQRTYCAECVPPPAKEGTSLRNCWACAGILQDTDPGLREKPFWKSVRDVLLYPQKDPARIATGALALLLWLGSLSPPSGLLYLPAILILVYVIHSSAKGIKTLPVRPDPPDMREVLERWAVALAVVAALAAPIYLANTYLPLGIASVATFLLGLAVFAYYPMATGIAVLSERPFEAFRPAVVFRHMLMMAEDYVTLLLGLLALSVCLFLAHFVVASIPLLGIPLAKAILAYGLFAGAHILGWTFYLNLGRLGWRRVMPI